MSESTLVSVVMVVCNVDRFLGEAIESILNQTFRDFEFVIVDFGSTDKSKEIISSYAAKDSRIKFHEIPHCRLSEARDAAARLATGKYIAITDADDVSLPDRLLWQVEFMESNPQVGVVGGGVEFIDAAGRSLTSTVTSFGINLNNPTENSDIQSEMLSRCAFWAAVLVRREAFLRAGGYRSVFVQAEDYDLYMRISDHYELANLKQVVFKYRVHAQQVSIRKKEQQALHILAVPASAMLRRSGSPDPLDQAKEITPEVLVGMGVSEAKQQSYVRGYYEGWIRIMCAAGEWSTALNAAKEMIASSEAKQEYYIKGYYEGLIRAMCAAGEWSAALNASADMLKSSDWKHIGPYASFDMRMDVAKLYWTNKRFFISIMTAVPGLIRRPRLGMRFLTDLLRGSRPDRAASRLL